MINQSLTTASDTSASVRFPGGNGSLMGAGTFGSGTLKLQCQIPGDATWIDVGVSGSLCQLTANGVVNFCLPACDVRVTLSESSGANVKVGVFRNMAGNLALG
jgi:hypothetical protein